MSRPGQVAFSFHAKCPLEKRAYCSSEPTAFMFSGRTLSSKARDGGSAYAIDRCVCSSLSSINKSIDLRSRGMSPTEPPINPLILLSLLFPPLLSLHSDRDPEHQLGGDRAQPPVAAPAPPGLQALLRVPGQVVGVPLRSQRLRGLQGEACRGRTVGKGMVGKGMVAAHQTSDEYLKA